MTDAAIRAADGLLHKTGGWRLMLRMPTAATAGDDTEQLGLATPEFQDMPLAPATFRKTRGTVAEGKATRWELLASISAVERLVGSLAYSSAAVLLADAAGVLVDGVLMEIESATESVSDGSPYVYRLLLRAPLARVV